MNKIEKLKLLLGGLILTGIVYAIANLCGHYWNPSCSFLAKTFPTHITMLVLSLGLIYLLRDRLGYRIAWPKPKLILRPMLYGLLAAFVTNFILGILFFFLGATAEKHPAIEGMTAVQYLVFIIILAPIAEEHLFRGFLQNYLKPLKDKGFNLFGLRITFPVLMSAIAFSLAHLILLASGASGLFVTRVLVFTFVLGLIAGYYQEKHDNIAYAILVHAAGNILGLMSIILTAG